MAPARHSVFTSREARSPNLQNAWDSADSEDGHPVKKETRLTLGTHGDLPGRHASQSPGGLQVESWRECTLPGPVPPPLYTMGHKLNECPTDLQFVIHGVRF